MAPGEGHMTVITLVERFDQLEPGVAEAGGERLMGDPWRADDIDCPATQVIAVGHAANRAIMLDRAKR